MFTGMNIKKRIKNNNEYSYFLEPHFVGGNRLFVLANSSQDADSKRFTTRRYYLPKEFIDSYNVIINRKNIYD